MDSNYRFRAKTGTLWSPRPFSISLKLPDSPQEESGFEPLIPPSRGTGYQPR